MGLIYLPNIDHILEIEDPEQRTEAILNTMGLLMKALSEINGYITTKNVKELNAKVVNAGTLNANKVTIKAEDGDRYYQFDGDGFRAFNGSQETLDFDLHTGNLSITGIINALGGKIGGWTLLNGALYSSTTSYPRIVFDPTNNEIKYYFADNNYIQISSSSDGYGQYPKILFVRGSRVSQIGQGIDDFLLNTVFGEDMQLSAGGNLKLFANSGNVQFQSWGKIFNNLVNQTLEQALANKLDRNQGMTIVVPVSDGSGNVRNLNFVNGQLVAII